MDSQFVIHGRPARDSELYPWALGSIARGLLFYGEAIKLKGNKLIAAIATYYSLFHLSMFLMFTCPNLLSSKERKVINDALGEGRRDPSPREGSSLQGP